MSMWILQLQVKPNDDDSTKPLPPIPPPSMRGLSNARVTVTPHREESLVIQYSKWPRIAIVTDAIVAMPGFLF